MTQPDDDFEAPDQEALVDDVDEMMDASYSPPESYRGEGFGTTAEEALQGESIDERLRQEQPDPDPYADTDEELDDGEVGTSRAGRLVDPDAGFGEDVGIDGAGASAEEAAVHIVED